jgi:hypothetical protein
MDDVGEHFVLRGQQHVADAVELEPLDGIVLSADLFGAEISGITSNSGRTSVKGPHYETSC